MDLNFGHDELAKAINAVAAELSQMRGQLTSGFEFFKSTLQLATKHDLKEMEKRIMSKVTEFAGREAAKLDRIASAVDGLQGDVTGMKDLITKLQESLGDLSPEDQATLDALESRTGDLATKLEALDAETAPVTPPDPAPAPVPPAA